MGFKSGESGVKVRKVFIFDAKFIQNLLGMKTSIVHDNDMRCLQSRQELRFEPLNKEVARHAFLVNHRSYKLSIYLSCNN